MKFYIRPCPAELIPLADERDIVAHRIFHLDQLFLRRVKGGDVRDVQFVLQKPF
jgi:hypothetical protein